MIENTNKIQNRIIDFEVCEEDGKIVNKQIVKIVLKNNEEIDAALDEIKQEITRLEIHIDQTQKALESMKKQEQALLKFKGKSRLVEKKFFKSI